MKFSYFNYIHYKSNESSEREKAITINLFTFTFPPNIAGFDTHVMYFKKELFA